MGTVAAIEEPGLVIPEMLGGAATEAEPNRDAEGQRYDMVWEPEGLDMDPGLSIYRDQTLGMLRRYNRMAVEARRLPSLGLLNRIEKPLFAEVTRLFWMMA